jgi:hypothetical protein
VRSACSPNATLLSRQRRATFDRLPVGQGGESLQGAAQITAEPLRGRRKARLMTDVMTAAERAPTPYCHPSWLPPIPTRSRRAVYPRSAVNRQRSPECLRQGSRCPDPQKKAGPGGDVRSCAGFRTPAATIYLPDGQRPRSVKARNRRTFDRRQPLRRNISSGHWLGAGFDPLRACRRWQWVAINIARFCRHKKAQRPSWTPAPVKQSIGSS